MQDIPRDVFRSLIKQFSFKESRVLLRISRRWNTLYESEYGHWQKWCQEEFGDIDPKHDIPDFSTFPDRWRLLFILFWKFRSRASTLFDKKLKPLAPGNEISQCWYYRSKDKPTIYASNLCNLVHLIRGDILIGAKFDVYDNTRGEMYFVCKDGSSQRPISNAHPVLRVPSEFAFPEFLLSYFLIESLNNSLNIRMAPEDLAALTFHLHPSGWIIYYEDPRAPGIKFVPKMRVGLRRPTPETLMSCYMGSKKDIMSVVCEGLTSTRCTFNMPYA